MYAVVIIGKENLSDPKNMFSKEAEKLLRALRVNLGLKWMGECAVLKGSRQYVLYELQDIFIKKRKEDICLFYIGHGQEEGWSLDGLRDWELIQYNDLSFVFARHEGNLILVNDCCFAGSAKKVMEHRLGSYLLIAAMPENEKGHAQNFLTHLLESWHSGKMFFPGVSKDNPNFIPVLEGNEDLQRLVFSKIKIPL